MAEDFYKQTLAEISLYFNVSDACAMYMFHRAKRSKRKDDSYMKWSLQLQNALVKSDKSLGLNWESIHFGLESKELLFYGINIYELSSVETFRWISSDSSKVIAPADAITRDDNEWITVKPKKDKSKKKNIQYKFTSVGIIV
jgi:hypothetical protein